MFEHSAKVPRHYKIAANILKKVSTEGGSLKSLIYDSKLRHYRLNVLYALITCAIRNAEALKRIFLECHILEKEPRLDPWLARILAVEILMGKKSLPGHSKPEQTLLQYREQIQSYAHKHPEFFDSRGSRKPRYVRVNTIKLEIDDFISSFENEGYRFVPCTTGSYNDYLIQVRNLKEEDFLQDYHVKVIFAFHPDTKLHDHEWCLDGKILLQDKATAMSVYLLAPEQMSVTLDMCAAPGMKTTQIAASIQCKGLIYAVERNVKRFETLVEFINKTNSLNVEALNLDAFDIRQDKLDKVEYILLDPSCSGSGMDYHVHNYGDGDNGRLENLTAMQEKLLRHAMNSFPKAKRIVYSTCSLLPEENEKVVKNVVKGTRGKWQVQDIRELLKGQWNNFGSGPPGSIASKCLYAKPESDLTTGFFLAVIDRNPKDLSRTERLTEIEHVQNTEQDNELANPFIKKSKRSDKHKFTEDIIQEIEHVQNTGLEENFDKTLIKKSKKSGKHKATKDFTQGFEHIQITELHENIAGPLIKKSKKSKKHKATEDCTREMDHEEYTELEKNLGDPLMRKSKKNDKHNATEDFTREMTELEKNPAESFIKKSRKSRKHKMAKDIAQADEQQVEDVSEFNNQKDEKKSERKTKSKKKHKTDDDGKSLDDTNNVNVFKMEVDEQQVEEVSEFNNQKDEKKPERKTKSKKKHKTDNDGKSLDDTNNVNVFKMEQEIPEKRRKMDIQSEESKKKKRKNNIDVSELMEECQTESEPVSKKKNSKTKDTSEVILTDNSLA